MKKKGVLSAYDSAAAPSGQMQKEWSRAIMEGSRASLPGKSVKDGHPSMLVQAVTPRRPAVGLVWNMCGSSNSSPLRCVWRFFVTVA